MEHGDGSLAFPIGEDPPKYFFGGKMIPGGKEGWFYSNWLWRLRGAIDRILLGIGSSRGRRSSSSLRVDDVIDFWRVEGLKQDAMLPLRAEMELPGKAWLQFNVAREEGRSRLSVTAYDQPRGLLGKPYW